jgi:hypothetical protein
MSQHPPSTWTPPYGTWGPAAPDAAPPPVAPRQSRAGFYAILGVCAVVVVGLGVRVAATAAVDAMRAPLHTPDTVGGYPRLATSAGANIEDATRAAAPARSHPQVAVYGRTTPRYLLFAAYTAEKSGSAVVAHLGSDLASVHGTFGPEVAEPGGITCRTVTIAHQRTSAICGWAGDGSNGAVLGYGTANLPALAKVTAAARTRVEARS